MRRSKRDIARAARMTPCRAVVLGGARTAAFGILADRVRHLGVREAAQRVLLAKENRISRRDVHASPVAVEPPRC